MIKKILAGLAGSAAALALVLVPAQSASAATTVPCEKKVYTLGVGGFGDPDATIWKNVDERVRYSAQLSGRSAQEGVDNLQAAALARRALCPSQALHVFGFSEGAGVVHSWVSQKQFPNSSAVLIGDPKRPSNPGGPGFASLGFLVGLGAPLTGVDRNYGNVPVLQVCNSNDGICDITGGPVGYLFTGAHLDYDFDVNNYWPRARGDMYFRK